MKPRIVMVDDSEQDAELVRREMVRSGDQLELVHTPSEEAFRAALDAGLVSAALVDSHGLVWDPKPELHGHSIPFIAYSGAPTAESSRGSACVLDKRDIDQVVPAIHRILQDRQGQVMVGLATSTSNAVMALQGSFRDFRLEMLARMDDHLVQTTRIQQRSAASQVTKITIPVSAIVSLGTIIEYLVHHLSR